MDADDILLDFPTGTVVTPELVAQRLAALSGATVLPNAGDELTCLTRREVEAMIAAGRDPLPHGQTYTTAGSAPRPQEGEAAALPVGLEWQAILDAMEFTERQCGLVSDAHLRARPKVERLAARHWNPSPLPPRDERRAEQIKEEWAVCMPVYNDGTGRRETGRYPTLEDAQWAKARLFEPYRPHAWIERITTSSERVADSGAASPRPGAEATSEERRKHLEHCPAHPYIATCICDDDEDDSAARPVSGDGR
jgi:hypothetical protein